MMWVWVYKGVLEFSLRLKIKNVSRFSETLCFAGNFSRFSERVFECCCLAAKKVREKEMTKIFFVDSEKRQERTRK